MTPLARAQEFYGGGVSARTAAQGGIYTPSAANVTDALALNPAGLAALDAPTVNLSATGVFARGAFSDSANAHSPMQPTQGFVPFGAFGTPVGHSRWSVGAGFSPDLLSAANWRYRDSPGGAGVTYGLQGERSRILAFRSAAGVGYSFSPGFAVGATVGAVYNSNTLDAPYIFQSQPVLKGLKTLLDLHTAGLGWNAGFGMRAKLRRRFEVGAAYRTPTSITSSGTATGNLNALFSALGVESDPAFAYRAHVKVVLPQSALLSALWQVNPRIRLSVQADWTDWRNSFDRLPVTLTGGTNAVVNNLLHSSSLSDAAPLDWKQQFTFRGALERRLGERFSVSGGFLHGNNPVPGSTLSPLTAAIMQNGVTAGSGYSYRRCRFDLSYGFHLTAQERSGVSALQAGEYSHSSVSVGTQGLTLSTSFQL